jgi:hypothetical protein
MKLVTSPVLRARQLLNQILKRFCNKKYILRTEKANVQ